MNSDTINWAARHDPICSKIYKGCICSDELPPLTDNSAWIINLNPRNSEISDNSHWVYLRTYSKKHKQYYAVDYLCSGGGNIHDSPFIANTVLAYSSNVYNLPFPLQSANEVTNCGSYSLLFLLLNSRGLTGKYISKFFFTEGKEPTVARDIMVCHIVYTLFDIKGISFLSTISDRSFLKKVKIAQKQAKKKKRKSINKH